MASHDRHHGRPWLLDHRMVGISKIFLPVTRLSVEFSQISDRFGRTRILGFTLFGLLSNDFIFIFVTKNYDRVPGGYWFLIGGPIIEGLAGGQLFQYFDKQT